MTTTEPAHVSYIERTRSYYSAQGYDRPYAWACHRDVPFAELPRALAECRVGVVTTASPWLGQTTADGVLRGAKEVYSAPADPLPERLYTDDLAWDELSTHTDDVPSFLPIPQLRQLAAEGRIASAPERFHGVPTDYSQRRTEEGDAPEILRRLREDAADVALLVPL